MKEMKFYGETNMGMRRTNNEDAFVAQKIWNDRFILCIAIDGVGGYEGGEVAAQIAQDYIPKHLASVTNDNPLEALKEAVVEANNRICAERQRDSSRPNMACVLSAGIIELDNNVIDIVHVGDSRIYRYENGNLEKITHDHSLVGYREEIGELTEDEAMNHPQRNIIDRLLGDAPHSTTDRNFFEAAKYPLDENTQLLFCSDGLTDLVTSAEIREILDQRISIQEKTKLLIDKANAKGGKDNITVVLAIAENPNARPKQAVVEPPRHQQVNIDENQPAKGKKSRKILWICLIALLLIILAFLAGNFIATKGVVCVPKAPAPVNNADTISVLNHEIDTLNLQLEAANDSIVVLNEMINQAKNSLNPQNAQQNKNNTNAKPQTQRPPTHKPPTHRQKQPQAVG